MVKYTKKLKRNLIRCLAVLSATFFSCNVFVTSAKEADEGKALASMISQVSSNLIKTNQEKFYNTDVVRQLPETVADNEDISVIVAMNTTTVMDAYENSTTNKTLSDYVISNEGQKIAKNVDRERKALMDQLKKSSISYTVGEKYDTILSGFELTIKAGDFDKLNKLLGAQATIIVGEQYEACETEVVTNDVEVYETGIFDSSDCDYQGDGVVVAVLDTGLDYTHTAFSESNFTVDEKDLAFTVENVSAKIDSTTAASYTGGLTGADVYVSRKVPFAYDYADKDPDVFPINSSHGTHVAGVIAGNDKEITGVAPNAQLAIMKVFSDMQQGARTSWILAALEDCVALGVDVINMSLGTSCGFASERDDLYVNDLYNRIRAAGISLICAASNDYNATHGSTKNGSNPLTRNPDSGTVGSPSTYDAALSVASVDGVKTPYLMYGEEIIYFTEAATSNAEIKKKFVDDILKTVGEGVTSHSFTYVTIPGLGRSSDYPENNDFYKGKIVLVKRGVTTFEEKVRVALKEKGAAGIIIYNNVSGTISMQVGDDVGAVCSITQDYGEMLAAQGTGTITIDKKQIAGPFMSDFSSWGPTSDLQIKPEITAHGGEIYSAVPGQHYERMSGTSMAAPNQAGATALIRQYVKDDVNKVFGDLTPQGVTALVNQLMMSTTDIVYNTNGLPYAIRKQGSGLVNIKKATTAESYLTTFNKDGEVMDKTKLELGDDKDRTGVYTMQFAINNISKASTTYNVDSIIMTEGVSSTHTSHGDTTSTQNGYLLKGTTTTVTSVSGGQQNGNQVTVGAGQTATVSVKVVLSEEDKAYIEDSFEYGMYVEGFITLKAEGTAKVNLNVPLLAFYGDWTEAPIFDEEYYDTNPDELNKGLDEEDKLMADAYATKVVGGMYSDYIAIMGEYYFQQDPSATPIAADKDHIAMSYQSDDYTTTISSLEYVWAGLLRNCREVSISIVEDATGKEIFSRTNYNQRKSYSQGSTVYYSSIEVDFSALQYKLKNNTQYTVTIDTYIDYGANEDQNNARNRFEFPLFIDFEAPIVTDVAFRSEYDKNTKSNKLYADISVYDNHYAQAIQVGQLVEETDPETTYTMQLSTFGEYITPVYSAFNSTSVVSFELTEYISQLKNSISINYNEDGMEQVNNSNSFIINCYDYAFNAATYEIQLPDDILALHFSSEEVKLNPNETLVISDVLEIYPGESWMELLTYTSDNPEAVDIVNGTIIAKTAGETATITVTGYDAKGNKIEDSITVTVLKEGDEGYYGDYTLPEVNSFTLKGYKTIKAYYGISLEEREIGLTGGYYEFGDSFSLSMYPSESVKLDSQLNSYISGTWVSYSVGNSKIATVDEEGVIVAQAEGNTIVTLTVMSGDKATLYSARVAISVKDPFTSNAIYLMSYKGLGGEVIVPDDRGITTINSFAFSNYEYVDKDPSQGDVIDDEDPYLIKQWFIGDDTITKVVLPEGVTTIESYAFAALTALEEVVFPSTLNKIGLGAFYGCEKLTKITYSSENNLQFINKQAFSGCSLAEGIDLSSVVAIGNYAFENSSLNYVELPRSAQSLGEGAFAYNTKLTSVTFDAPKIKIGSSVFIGCENLSRVDVNADVIPAYAFYGCEKLTNVYLGKDVKAIGEFAFGGTNVSAFKFIDENATTNGTYTIKNNGTFLYKGDALALVAPAYKGDFVNAVGYVVTIPNGTKSIVSGAFAANSKINMVKEEKLPEDDDYVGVETIGSYAFASCTALEVAAFKSLTSIGDYAFYATALTETPNLAKTSSIGKMAFALSLLEKVEIPNDTEEKKKVGDYAFAYNTALEEVTVGKNVVLGEGAFYCPIAIYSYENTGNFAEDGEGGLEYYVAYTYDVVDSEGNVETYTYYRYDYSTGAYSSLSKVTLGDNVQVGESAFNGNANLAELNLGNNVQIGDYAFYNAAKLASVDLSKVVSIGAYAFSGEATMDLWKYHNTWNYAYEFATINGETIAIGYKYSSFAPALTYVDLSSIEGADALGEGAFASNESLKEVKLGEGLTEISAYAFAGCLALDTVVLPATVTKLGDYAFYDTALSELNLENVETLGERALALTALSEVTLKENATIGDGAFMYNFNLTTINNLDKAKEIGAYAFAYVALEEVTLTNVETIGDYAFMSSAVTKVTFGEKLTKLGENPFNNCMIATFAKETDVLFHDQKVGTELTETYNLNEVVKVIDGVLYQVVENGGMELVSYPVMKQDVSFTVAEGTVRISATAFAFAPLGNVTLPTTLKAIGAKAFYGCGALETVVFTSYYAPTLEEDFDSSIWYTYLPYSGSYYGYEGLGISPYFMWSAITSFNTYYYGANFVNYVGLLDEANKLVMVKPVNGQNYDTFIMSQYFRSIVDGAATPTQDTLTVIDMIAKLPAVGSITLEDAQAVANVRAAYDALSNEQKALVSNYDLLKQAESRITYLNSLEEDPGVTGDPIDGNNNFDLWKILLIAVGAVVICVGGVFFGVYAKKKLCKGSKVAETAEVELPEEIGESVETEETMETEETVEEEIPTEAEEPSDKE